MADAQSALEVLRRTDATPIAQLRPDIDDASSCTLDGVVTITWPYSIVTKSVAFILAEHDFRLRRDKGQLRVELHGAAAEAVAKSSIAGGDELRISLRGAEWEEHQAPTRLPSGTLACQLKFSNRLTLEVRRAQDQGSELIDVDGPELQAPRPEPSAPLPERATPDSPPSSSLPAKRPASSTFGPDEFASPAFLKRARVSYGSLYEGGLDIFEEEQEAKAKGKRRPRFSMQNTAWRYNSRSPSIEADKPSDPDSGVVEKSGRGEDAQSMAGTPKTSPPRPSMVDEACQTQEVYFSPTQMEPHTSIEAHVSGSTLQPASASALLGAEHQAHGTGFQTPSRTLFDRGSGQRNVFRTPEAPVMAYETAASNGDDLGLGPGPHAASADMLDAPHVAASVTSTAALPEGISAPGHTLPAIDGNHVDAAALNIDPRLQFPGAVPAPDDIYFDAPPAEHGEWHSEALAAGQPWASVQENSHPPAAAMVDPSPVRSHSSSISSTSRDSNRSESDPNSASGSDEKASQGSFIGEGEEADTTMRDNADYRDEGARDIPGDDYDLRKYDRARDDDSEGSEDESGADGSDVERQAIDLSEEDTDDVEDELRGRAPGTGQYNEAAGGAESMRRTPGVDENEGHPCSDDEDDSDDEAAAWGTLEEGDAETENYDEDEDDGDSDDEEEEEEYTGAFNAASGPVAPQEPVFISLLSDSEDEQEPQAEPEPPSTLSSPARDLMAINGSVQRVSPRASMDAEAQRNSDSSASSDLHVEEDESFGHEAVDRAHVRQHLETEPMPSQPAQSPVPEAAEYSHESSNEDSSVNDDSEVEEERSKGDGRYQNLDVDSVEPVASAVAEVVSSEPMDVDEEPGDGAPIDQESIKEAPASDCEAQTRLPTSQDRPSGADEPEALGRNRLADEKVMGTLPEHEETAVEVLDPRSPELQGIHEEEQVLEASGSLLQDAFPDESSKHHQPGSEAAGVDKLPGVTEIEEAHGESSSPEAPEDSAMLEAPEAAIPGDGAKQLPTPSETQPKEGTAEPADAEYEATEGDEHDLAAQAQIMTEYQEYYTPAKQNTTQTSQSETRDEEPVESAEPEMLITVKSLRSRVHGRSGSGDANRESHHDPSVRLAKASAPHPAGNEQGTEPKSPTRLRVAGNRVDRSDPGLLLARAPTAEAAHAKERQPQTRSRAASSTAGEAATVVSSAGPSSSSPRGKRRQATPEVTRELRSKPHEAARHSTPDTVAETLLKSPSVAGSVEDEDVAAVKRNLQKTLRTALPDFVPLRSLRSSLNKTVDILAVSTSTPPQPHRPKHGPRDYMLELILTDASTAPTSVVVAHLFRPHQASLPVLRAGDMILLRRVQVVSVKGRGFGARAGETSAWAVFEKDDEEMLPQIKGPPVEVTEGEVEYAQGLKRWWAMQGEGALAKVDKATQKASQAGKGDSR